MNALRAGCLAVALLFASAALAGCVGSEAGGEDAPASDAEDAQANDTADKTDTSEKNVGNVTDDASQEEKEARVPDDAMSGDPVESEPGRARFVIEDTAATSVAAQGGEAKTYELHNPGDLTFFDITVRTSANDENPAVTDLDLYLYNASDEEIASSATGRTFEYVWEQPAEGEAQNYTIEVVPYIANDAPYTLTVTAWTAEDWNVSESQFVDAWQVSYEWGQLETTEVSVTAYPHDYVGVTDDGMINIGGTSWVGCGHQGGSRNVLPCGQKPYTSVSVVIDDDVAGQQVAATWTTCSMDDDTWCGETDNVNDSKADGNPGPNELTATFCGVVDGLTRDRTTDKDGTGPGVWDQRGETYKDAEGNVQDHPGVDGMAVFLMGPQQGGGGVCSQANPYTGPTTGTITLIARK